MFGPEDEEVVEEVVVEEEVVEAPEPGNGQGNPEVDSGGAGSAEGGE